MGEFDKLMTRAFKLAKRGLGYTSPNPPVGAVLFKDGRIIGEGYHRRAGLPHAEIEALNVAGENARGATLVTTLEPCSHFGKTPPCTDSIIAAGIIRVVSAICDANPIVCNNGYKSLNDAGIDVIEGIQAEYAREFYRPYFKFITSGLPFVTLKYAQSLDGRIATRTGHSQWISSPKSLKFSHRLRAINDAVIVGNGTVKKDDPKLTTRLVRGKNPVRIVISNSGKIPLHRSLFTDGQSPTYIATSARAARNIGSRFQVIPLRKGRGGLDLGDLLNKLGKSGIVTVLVEGGSGVLTSFLKQRLVDKIAVCVAPILIGDGIEAIHDLGVKALDQCVKLEGVEIFRSGPDTIISGYPVWK